MLSLITAILLRIFSNSGTNVFQKKLAEEDENPVVVNFINYFILSVFSLPLIFLIKNPSGEMFFNALLGGIFGAICNCFMVMALERGQLSVLGPINSYKSIVGLIFGILILHEYPNGYGVLGMGLIIFGTYFIFDSPKDILKKDILYRFCALFFSAIEAVYIKKVILLSSVITSFVMSSIFGLIFSLILVKIFVKSSVKVSKQNIFPYFAAACCFGTMTFSTAYVFEHMNVGYALSLFQLSVILNVILGYKIFKEQNLLKKLAGSVIIVLGSVIILILGH